MTTSLHTRGTAPGDEIMLGRERISFKLTSEQSGGELAVFDVRMPSGGGPPMLHRHDPFELYRVRRGELAFYLEGEDGAVTRNVAGPGTVVPIAGGSEHTIRNESEEEAEAVVVFSPGEPMERFARAAGALSQGRAPAQDEVLALTQAHGIEITRSIEDALTETGEDETASRQAYLTIFRFSGDGDRLLDDHRKYADVMSEVGRDHGLILHAGARMDGVFLVSSGRDQPGPDSTEHQRGGALRRLRLIRRALSRSIARRHCGHGWIVRVWTGWTRRTCRP
jgi:mannose-6-phosphate isomerase-like protein (cupin superfamily)